MNKQEMIEIIKDSGLQNDIVLTSGGALMMYGIKDETNDIDVECYDMEWKSALIKIGYEANPAALGGVCVQYRGLDIHFQNNKNKKINIIDGIKCLDLSEIIDQYKMLYEIYSNTNNLDKAKKYYTKYTMLQNYIK